MPGPNRQNPAIFTDATGQLVNGDTGEYIKPGDPLWKPEYSAVLADQPPAGQHYVYPNGGDHPETRYLESNNAPWYKDPAFLGMLGVATLGFVPAVTAWQGFGAGTGGAAGGTGGFSTVGGPGGVSMGTSGAANGSWDAAGNFIGPSTVTGAGGSGLASFFGTPAGKIVLGLLAGGGSAALSHALIGNAAAGNVPPQLNQLLDQAVQRQQYQNPLFQAKQQGTYAMLPNFARTGTNLTGTLPGLPGASYATPSVQGPAAPLPPQAGTLLPQSPMTSGANDPMALFGGKA